MLLKSKFFWISTVVFLIVVVGAILKIYPPILSQFKENREKIVQLDAEIEAAEAYSKSIAELRNRTEELELAYNQAERALPVKADSDVLLLELEGLLNNLGLGSVKITVPFQNATPTSSTSSVDGAARPGGATTTPVVKNTAATTTFTLNGEIPYASAKTLIERLRNFSRWNKLKSIDIAKATDKYATTITAEFFTKAAPTESDMSSNAKVILDQAQKAFASLQSYTTKPDAATEGTFGRTNPFE